MVKKETWTLPDSGLPFAPWILINDPSACGRYAIELSALFPKVEVVPLKELYRPELPMYKTLASPKYRDKVIMVNGPSFNYRYMPSLPHAQMIREAAITAGCNFASINLINKSVTEDDRVKPKAWETNHHIEYVDVCADARTTRLVAEKLYQWLFSVFSVLETLHLISDQEMMRTDPISLSKGYKYCPLSQVRKLPKDKLVQFVALVVSKPVVGANRRLTWEVADKTGKATFYFQYRGPASRYTWDWVLSLKPGDRKCLPRMPFVAIKEHPAKTVVKTPFRVTGLAIRGTGLAVAGVGRGLARVGNTIKRGNPTQWVPEPDAEMNEDRTKPKKRANKDGTMQHKNVPAKSQLKFFRSRGEKTWKDDDSIASTTAGSIIDEKTLNFK